MKLPLLRSPNSSSLPRRTTQSRLPRRLNRLLHGSTFSSISAIARQEPIPIYIKNEVSVHHASDVMDNIEKVTDTLTSAFVGDPIYTWLLSDIHPSQHQTMLPGLFNVFVSQASLNNGILLEAGNFSCCALLMPPRSKLDNPWTMVQAGLLPSVQKAGIGVFKRAILEYARSSRSVLERSLTKDEQRRGYWNGVVIGTTPAQQRQGFATSVFLRMLDLAQSDGSPICFEATTSRNRDLYLKHGSKINGEFVVGRGKVGKNGVPKRNGEGITVWSMVWRP